MYELSRLEIEFINTYQGNVPLVENPYRVMGEALNVSESMMIDTIDQLLACGMISRFGPSYDASRLNGELTLAALKVPLKDFDYITNLVNLIPEVAHNYSRDHELNMWFVISSLEQGGVDRCIDQIEDATGLKVYNFPKQREFYLGLWLQVYSDGWVKTVPVPTIPSATDQGAIDALDRSIISATQEGLRLNPQPYTVVARSLGISTEEVISRMSRMLANGSIRRIGAIPSHYRLGLRGNGMTVWDVPDEYVEEVGKLIGELDFVSHCYERVRHPGMWGYNLFAMVHGVDRDEARQKGVKIRQLLGGRCRGHDVLFSTSVLKKTGMRIAA
jgi:DNA-binding Lrp family transcriptional regulator